jgi:hypothetical protein
VTDEQPAQQASSGPISVSVSGGGGAHVESGAVEALIARANPPPAAKDKLEEDRRKAAGERLRISIRLAKLIGYGALIAVVIQVVLADVAFFLYGFTNHWHIPAAAISAWLAAIVIQVVGVVMVVAKDIFPGGAKDEGGG